MNQLTTTKSNKAVRPWKQTLESIAPSFEDALPRHVTVDRFKRILANAISTDSYLQNAIRENPSSVWNSALACAKDGLIPDGREAALVVFKTKVKCADGITRSLATAQYMPMIGGILKMMRQSGEVSSLSVQVVHETDDFDYELGDNERITHKPDLASERGNMIAAYAILKTKDGGIYREIMGREQILAVKKISKARDSGPWSGPFESEMWKKTVLRRLAKRAPLSTDVMDLIQRDDGMYALPGDTAGAIEAPRPPVRASFDLVHGNVEGDYAAIEADEDDDDVLEGDGIPGEPTAQDEKPPKQVEEKPAETEVTPDNNDPYESVAAAKAAMKAAETRDDLDQILADANSCSWIDTRGRKTTLEMLYADLVESLPE